MHWFLRGNGRPTIHALSAEEIKSLYTAPGKIQIVRRPSYVFTYDQMVFRCWLSAFVGICFTVLAAFGWAFL